MPDSKFLENFIEESKKMWKVMKKPSKDELKIMVEITLMTTIFVGFIGYIIWKLVTFIIL